MSDYPEHEKLAKVKERSQCIGEFLVWLQHEKKILLATWTENDEDAEEDAELMPANPVVQNLLAEFFKIDLKKISSEKDQMLLEIRRASLPRAR